MRNAVLLLAAAAAAAEPAMGPREWAAAVPLDQVALILPAGADAAPLLVACQAAGADVATFTPADALDPSGLRWRPEVAARTVIVGGGIHTNPALLPLYAGYLAFGDAAYPGAGGYVVRCLARPFGADTAAIAIEASDSAGLSAGLARLAELLQTARNRRLPFAVEANLGARGKAVAAGAGDGGMRYALTGNAADAAKGLAALLSVSDPQTGLFGFGDYGIERWIRDYGYLQDCPGATPEQVAKLDQALFDTCRSSLDQFWRRRDGSLIGGRHQTMGTSAFMAAVQLLRRRGAPNAEADTLLEQWWNESLAYWTNACSTFHDDLEGIPSYHSPEATLDQALCLGLGNYPREQLPLAVLRAYAVIDNLGYYAGTGTYEECRPGDVYKPGAWGWLLAAAEYFHPGRGYGWLLNHWPNTATNTWGLGRSVVGARAFVTGEPQQPPGGLLGIVPVPLGAYRFSRLADEPGAGRRYRVAPESRSFEKLCFRDDFTPDGQYFVLEGYYPASSDNVVPVDPNCLIRFTDLGHVWLHSNSEKPGNLHRTAVWVTDGLNETPPPVGCELAALHNGAKVGLAASRLADDTAADWTRAVIWRRGRWFVLIDLLHQTRAGRFGLVCSFRTPQWAELTDDGLLAREGDAWMRVRNADPVRLALDGGDELEGAAIPRLLRETQLLDGDVGSLRTFRNLVYTADPEHPAELEIRPYGDHAALVRGTARGEGELALVAAGADEVELKVGRLTAKGRVIYVDAADWAVARLEEGKLVGYEGVSPEGVAAELKALWDQAGPAEHSRAAAGGAALRPTWKAEPFDPLPAAAPAPLLTCEPAGEGIVGSLFDGVIPRSPTVRWPAGEVKLTLDLHERRRLDRLDFQVGLFGRYNTIPDPATYPAPRKVVVELADDTAWTDPRRRELTVTADCTYENIHKGTVWPILRWTSPPLNEEARYVRLTFGPSDWPGPLGLNELSLRPAGPSSARLLGWRVCDIDGDGADELLAWSDQAELAVLSRDGMALLRRRFPGYITAVQCYPDLAPDGPRLLVTTREARLYCLDPNGAEVWHTDFLASAEQNTDLPIGYSIGLLKRPDGSPIIVVGNYNLASFVSPAGEVLKYERLPAAFQTMTLSRGADYTGDGTEEIVSTEVWGTLSVLSADLRRSRGGRLPRGKGLCLDYWQPPTAAEATALVATENGVGRLDLRTLEYRWLRNIAPLSDATTADLDGDGRLEVILAKSDGWVLVLDESGELKRSILTGEPVRAVAVVKGAVIAALPGRLVRIGDDDKLANLAVGDFSRLASWGDVLLAGGGPELAAYDL